MPSKTSSSPKSASKKKLFKQTSADLDDIFDKDISDTGNNNNNQEGTDEDEVLESTPTKKSPKRKSDESSPSHSSKKTKKQSPATKGDAETSSSKKKRKSSESINGSDKKKSPAVKKEPSPKQTKTPKKSPKKTPQKHSPKVKITVKEESEEEEPKGKGTWSSLFGQSSLLTNDDIELLSPLKTPRTKNGKTEKKAEVKLEKVWNRQQIHKHTNAQSIHLTSGNLTIEYQPKKSKTESVIVTVQTERPMDKDNNVSYFEITIDKFHTNEKEDVTLPATVFVGLTPAGYANDVPIGWETDSCGYSNNGFKWTGNGRFGTNKTYGEPYGEGDTIGCGLLHNSGEIFFTKNGMFQGIAALIRPGTPYAMYPTISIHGGNAVTLNYGQKAFSFDLKSTHYKQPSPTSSRISPVKGASPYKSPKKSPAVPVQKGSQDILCGLFLGQIPAPLTAAYVRGTIVDTVGRIDVVHEYNNPLPDAVDAVFVFPVDDPTNVFTFRVEIEGHVVVSQVIKPEGKPTNKDFLADLPAHCIRAPSFQCHINQVPAGKNIHITISYLAHMGVIARTPLRTRVPLIVQSNNPVMNVDTTIGEDAEEMNYLDPREDMNLNIPLEQTNVVLPQTNVTQYSYKFMLPATVYPHYCANWTDEVFFPQVRKPDIIPSKLNVDIRITQTEAVITDVQSDKIQLDLQKISQHEVRVKFGTRQSIDIDFVVNVLDSHAPQVFVERDAATNSAAALITWVPIYAQQAEGCEVNIVVDCTSKDASVLDDLARIANLCLRCIFYGRIQVFFLTGGDKFVKVFDKPEHFNTDSLTIAAQALLRQSDKKGQKAKSIDMENVLKEILEEPADQVPHGSYQDIIFIKHATTQIENQEQTHTYVENKCNVPGSNIRLFGLMVDPKHATEETPDIDFFDSLCRLSNGTLFKLPGAKQGLGKSVQTFVLTPPAVINEVVKHAMTSSVNNISINCHTTKEHTQIPSVLPTLFFGDRLVSYMLFDSSDISIKSVTVKCDSIFHAESVSTTNIKESRHTSLIKHAAKWRIDELRAQLHRGTDNKVQMTKEIEQLSLDHQVVADSTTVTMQDQPVAVPVVPPQEGQPQEEEAPVKKRQKKTANALAVVHIDKLSSKEILNLTHDLRRKKILEIVASEHEERDEILQQLILLQTAEGYWNLDKDLAEVLQVPWESCTEQTFLKSTPRKVRFIDRLDQDEETAPIDPSERFKVIFATCLALCFMDFYVPHRHLEYEMIRAKGRRWLRRQPLRDEPTWPEWLETAKEFLTQLSSLSTIVTV